MGPSSQETLSQSFTARWGYDQSRAAAPDDAVAGVQPAVVLAPRDTAALAEMLRWANQDSVALVPRGGGTKLTWGGVPDRIDAVIATTRLTDSLDHCAGDLTVSVPSGLSFGALNRSLARERQWLPLDPRCPDRATIGGVIATNDSGPHRHRYGTPRDLIIGVEMMLADGRHATAGGRVVKNVAGYDLPRMLCGSFGSLAVITRAIFKLVPLAAASRTVVATAGDLRRLSDLAVAIAAGPLTPSAVELEAPVGRLLIRIESSPASADRQAALACEACEKAGAAAAIVSAAEEGALWQAHENLPAGEGALLRVSVLPTDVGTLLDEVDRIAGAAGLGWQASGQAALGTMRVLLESPPTAAARTAEAITKLRQGVATRGGSAIVLAAHPDVRSRVVPWGTAGDALPLMQTVKARFDPNGILPRGPWALGTRR